MGPDDEDCCLELRWLWPAVVTVAKAEPPRSWFCAGCCPAPPVVFSHLDVLNRQTFSFRHQLQPQLVVRQSLQLRMFKLKPSSSKKEMVG
jgi:hypothetical protein